MKAIPIVKDSLLFAYLSQNRREYSIFYKNITFFSRKFLDFLPGHSISLPKRTNNPTIC